MFAEAVEIRDRLADLVDRLDPDAVSGTTAREIWAVLDKSERLCAAGKTLLARRIAETHQPHTSGSKTAAEDLARKAGTSTGAAKDTVDTSRRLAEQPGVEGALRKGELSLAQAALISSATATNPAEEKRLVELASRVSVAELREECARVKAAADPDPEARNRRLHAQRSLRRWVDGEGFWNLHAKGTPQAGAAFNVVLDALTDRLFKAAHQQGRREPIQAYAFDALTRLADQATDQATDRATGPSAPSSATTGPATEPAEASALEPRGQCPQTGRQPPTVSSEWARPVADGEDGADSAGPDGAGGLFVPGRSGTVPAAQQPPPAAPGRWNPRYRALLRVDLTALHRGRVHDGEVCEIAGVGPVPVSVAEGLLGKAVLHLVITRGTDVLNVTHLGRGPTAAQRVALAWRNQTCTVEGCFRTRTENDHREPWVVTRHTRLDELDPLCAFHHDLKTRFGWALMAGTGKRPMVPPDDPRHPQHLGSRAGEAVPAPGEAAAAGGAAAGVTRPSAQEAGPPPRPRRSQPAQPTLPDPPGDPPRAA